MYCAALEGCPPINNIVRQIFLGLRKIIIARVAASADRHSGARQTALQTCPYGFLHSHVSLSCCGQVQHAEHSFGGRRALACCPRQPQWQRPRSRSRSPGNCNAEQQSRQRERMVVRSFSVAACSDVCAEVSPADHAAIWRAHPSLHRSRESQAKLFRSCYVTLLWVKLPLEPPTGPGSVLSVGFKSFSTR